MEENRFDPLQFIGFLLISGILMFWFYDNQSNMIENQEQIVDDSQIEVVQQPSNIVDSSYNDYEDNDEFSEEIIVLENSNILLEVSTKGAEIKKLLLKDFKNYNEDPLFLIDKNKSIFSFNIPVGRNSNINSQDLNYTAEIIDENSSVKLKAQIDSRSELELSFFLADNSSIVDFELDIIDNTNSNYDNVELIWGRDSFRNSKSIDYENRYTALSYGFENNKDSYLSVAGTTNKVIDNVNWVSFREHFFSSILILNNESNQVEISSEDLSGNDALDKKFTKRFLANIPLSLDSNNQLSFSMYYGTTDYEILLTFVFSEFEQKVLWFTFFLAFAAKVPMMPVHLWLPEAHVEAPTAGSVLLAAILLKMAGYGFIRFSLGLFPDASEVFTPLIYLLSVIAIIFTSFIALMQEDMKKLIAYSSVAHMGFVTLGIFTLQQQGIEGSIIQMISHGLVAAALFLCVGVVYDRMHSRLINTYGGVVSIIPKYSVLFMLFTLAALGLPGTSGFVGEFLILMAAFKDNFLVAVIASIGVIIGAAYMLWLYKRVVFGKLINNDLKQMIDLNKSELFILSCLGIPTLFFSFYPDPLINTIEVSISDLIEMYNYKLVSKF